jgi:hypothetical protein
MCPKGCRSQALGGIWHLASDVQYSATRFETARKAAQTLSTGGRREYATQESVLYDVRWRRFVSHETQDAKQKAMVGPQGFGPWTNLNVRS